MNRFLIFRTDRIGDYIFSRVLIESIKKENKKNIIDFVCSEYNSKYIKNYTDIRKIYILDKYNFSLMFKNLVQINKSNYDYLIILDGKRRSVFYSLFLKAKFKIAVLKSFRPYLLLKIFFNKYFINSEVNTQYNNFCSIINYLNIKVPKNINYFNNYNLKKPKFNFLPKKYTLLHLDEKWFEGYYYNDFKYMSLNVKNFNNLIKTIKKKFKNKIIITSGNIKINQFDKIIKKNFVKNKKNYYKSIIYKKDLIFVDNTDFRDLEYIVKYSNEVICCEGAISHVSNGFNKETYALIENINTARFWTSHMKKIILLKRSNIDKVCKQISTI